MLDSRPETGREGESRVQQRGESQLNGGGCRGKRMQDVGEEMDDPENG